MYRNLKHNLWLWFLEFFYITYNKKHTLTNNQLRRKDWFQGLNHNSGHTRMPSTLLHQGLHQQRFSSLCWPRFSRRRIPTPAYRILIINYQSQFFCCFYNASSSLYNLVISLPWCDFELHVLPVCIVNMMNEEQRIHVASSQIRTSPPQSLIYLEIRYSIYGILH